MTKQIDWDGMQREWVAGIKTCVQLSKEYGVSRAAIIKHWRKEGVERDLQAQIKAKADSLVKSKVKLKAEIDPVSRPGFVYVIYLDDSSGKRHFKIGLSASFSSRVAEHQCSSPFDICVACAYFTGNMRVEERALHALFSEKRVRGEWFELDVNDLTYIATRALLI